MKQRKYYIDRNISSGLIYALMLCLSVFVVSGASGSDALFYAAGPLISVLGLIFVSVMPAGDFVRHQTAYRIGRDRILDVLVFLRGAMLVQLLVGVVTAACGILGGEFVGAWAFGSRYDSLAIYTLMPGLILGLLCGPLKGFLDGVGAGVLSRIGLYIGGACTLVCSVVFSRLGRTGGEKIAQLLLNDRYGAVYAGAGLGLGISCGWLAAFLFLGVCSLLVRHSLLISEAGLGVREEQTGGVMSYYFRQLLLPFLEVVLMLGGLLLSYRLGLHLYGDKDKTGLGLHWWDGFAGVALPVILGLACLCCIFVSWLPGRCAVDRERKNFRNLRLRYSLMHRLSGYLSIGISAFVFGAAKPIVQIVRAGLNPQARESAILTMKIGSINIFLLTCCMLIMLLFWKCGQERLLAACLGIAMAFQLMGAFLFMHVLTITVEALPISIGIFCAAFIAVSTLLGWGSVLHATDLSWLYDDLFVLIAAGVSAIPVCLLNDFVTDEIVPIGGVILLGIIYLICFVLFSILLNAVDLRNIGRIPGGKYLQRVGRLLGRE